LFKLCDLKGETHLEMAAVPPIVAVALKARPDSVCIVPEGPRELTTQGGLNLKADARKLGAAIAKLKKADIEVSLFIDPEAGNVRAAKSLGADIVELCTAAYAQAQGKAARAAEIERLELAAFLADELGLYVHAGHGLDYHNMRAVAQIPRMATLNIGFSVMARSMFVGLKTAVIEMKRLLAS
jgi:pyridoxine 5-phosphate synthase